MLDRTKRLTPAVALLTGLLVSLPTAQSQANANAKHKVTECSRISPTASRGSTRYSYASPKYNKAFAYRYMASTYGWCGGQFTCLVNLWNHESGWRTSAHNPSGAHGIPQALPGSKMATAGPNWYSDPHTQIKWGLKYIKGRYGSPCNALSSWNGKGWY